MPNLKAYTDKEAVEDLAKVFAQFTSGIKDAIPERDDRERAKKVLHALERQLTDKRKIR